MRTAAAVASDRRSDGCPLHSLGPLVVRQIRAGNDDNSDDNGNNQWRS
jgi:hypothetical protein